MSAPDGFSGSSGQPDPSQTRYRVVMVCGEDYAIQVTSPRDYQTSAGFARVLAETLQHDMVVERVEEI